MKLVLYFEVIQIDPTPLKTYLIALGPGPEEE